MSNALLFLTDGCGGILPIVRLIRQGLFPLIQIGIPIILIIMGSLDLGKAVLANEEKEIKEATSKLAKRAIAAVAVFFVVTLVTVLMNLVANNTGDRDIEDGASSWQGCWDAAGRR